MSQEFHNIKKCPKCGQWSDWNQLPTDTCQHCGAPLEENYLKDQARKVEDKKKKRIEIDLIQIYSTDSLPVKFGKYIIRTLQLSFVAILSFILWLLALLAG